MKKVKCSGCMQVLGVPAKFFGKKVTCPNCNLRLMISIDSPESSEEPDYTDQPMHTVQDSDSATQAPLPTASPPNFGKITTLRAIPRPAALAEAPPSTDTRQPTVEPRIESQAETALDDANRTPASGKTSSGKTSTGESTKRDARKANTAKPGKQTSSHPSKPVASITADPSTESVDSKASLPLPASAPSTTTHGSKTSGNTKPVTARIIQAREIKPDFDEEGDLPTLQLKDVKKVVPKKSEKSTSPVLLGVLVCSSLVISGLILVFGDFKPKVDEQAMQRAREQLTKFYTVRIDIPLKPYQLQLREAQLAHSRGDRQAEVRALRQVMKQFRAEDRNRFVGVTGSPTADSELEKLVSILLSEGHGERKGLFR